MYRCKRATAANVLVKLFLKFYERSVAFWGEGDVSQDRTNNNRTNRINL